VEGVVEGVLGLPSTHNGMIFNLKDLFVEGGRSFFILFLLYRTIGVGLSAKFGGIEIISHLCGEFITNNRFQSGIILLF
jgi:hypothetical protein